jgi:starch synthase
MPVRVCILASEAFPYAKTGGLADVVTALSEALIARGIEVTIVLPGYREALRTANGVERLGLVRAPISSRLERAEVVRVTGARVPTLLIHSPRYFDRDGLYGAGGSDYPDNAERFAFFCRAALEWLRALGTPPDVLHCHDWPAALAPAMLRATASLYPELRRVRLVQTIHNIAYQGRFPASTWHLLNLDARYFTSEWLEFHGDVNFLKAGLVFADVLTTVSPRYAREIQTPAFGAGLDGVLRARVGRLRGILNGIDYRVWNPSIDPSLPARYDLGDLDGKARCKADLQAALGLRVDAGVPLIAIVSRLVWQKGIDVALDALPAVLAESATQVVALGSGDPHLEWRIRALADSLPDRVAARTGMDEALAHRIVAGGDLLLMPSRYEPCGLSQMYALRYGTVPVVHATGGLDDTIAEYDPATGTGTGFKLTPCLPDALRETVRRALGVRADQAAWAQLRANGMRENFSWERSASAYRTMYGALMAAPAAA